ncbi:MAG: ATP-binding protein [Victivallaceae bacterium]|nr:ATP-binding protein [Victivallaceae bacterium]
MFFNRNLETAFKAASSSFSAVLLTGARQVGKTTFLRHIAEKERTYVSLDSLDYRQMAQNDPRLFLSNFPPPVIIDEIQYAPELLPYIKVMIDESRFNDSGNSNGMFWLTGSQQFHMMKNVTESLAGRIAVFNMLGLSNRELANQRSRPFLPDTFSGNEMNMLNASDFFKRIWRGSFPGVITRKDSDWSIFFDSYINTYIDRDVRDLTQVADLGKFYSFIKAAAARTGQLLNYANLARDADISQPTAKNWMSVLVTSGLVHLLYPFYKNLNKRMISTPKLYFLDTGLAAFLTNWNTPEVLNAGAMSGEFFETWCFSELLKSYLHSGLQAPFYYYRDKEKREIDLLIEHNGVLHPVEFKKSATLKKSDIVTFSVIEKFKVPVGHGALISLNPENIMISENCSAIPAPWL